MWREKKYRNLERLGQKKIPEIIWNLKIIICHEKLKKSNLLQDKGTWRKAVEPSERGLQRALKSSKMQQTPEFGIWRQSGSGYISDWLSN